MDPIFHLQVQKITRTHWAAEYVCANGNHWISFVCQGILPYRLIKASDYVTQKQLLAHVNIIMKHTPSITDVMFHACASLHHLLWNSMITRPGSTSAMAPDFSPKKEIVSSLQNCYSEEVLSTAPWSFFYPHFFPFSSAPL